MAARTKCLAYYCPFTRLQPLFGSHHALQRTLKHVTEGVARSANRAMYYAMGYKDEDFDKPMIGVANGHSTITPCNSGLQKLADAAIEEIAVARPTRRCSVRRPFPTASAWAPKA